MFGVWNEYRTKNSKNNHVNKKRRALEVLYVAWAHPSRDCKTARSAPSYDSVPLQYWLPGSRLGTGNQGRWNADITSPKP